MKNSDIDLDTLKEFHRIIMGDTAMWLNALDKDANVIMWNRAAEKISGYTQDEVLGRGDIWELLYPDEVYRNKIFAKALEIIEQGQVIEDFETTIHCKDGSRRVLSWNSHSITNIQGEVTGSLALAKDVTEIRDKQEQLEQALERAEALAREDELTGLFNRRAFFEQGVYIFKEMRRNRGRTSVIMMDLDHFKSINDQHGHAKGDEVLKNVANVIKKHVREIDIVGRLGGEEFGFILPNTDLEESEVICERLRVEISKLMIEGDGESRQVTSSFGLTISMGETDTLDRMLSRADDALYRAKKFGRNRIEIA
ncbi:MAG: sensor domain-containing diguanylate cyclase [Gammaproteobacteria bacterium]|nr:sensor domain-containing diguanylate cyclase [Gammaproteobacteria bacterium]